MLSVYVVCWIFLQTYQTYFCIQANNVDPDQTDPKEQSDLGPHCMQKWLLKLHADDKAAGIGGSVGCAVQLETRMSRVQPPPRLATFFHGDWSWNIFYGHSLLLLIQEGQLSVSGERMCTVLINRLED